MSVKQQAQPKKNKQVRPQRTSVTKATQSTALPSTDLSQQADTSVSDLPAQPTAASLRQMAVLQMQEQHGNAHVQRMLNGNSRLTRGNEALEHFTEQDGKEDNKRLPAKNQTGEMILSVQTKPQINVTPVRGERSVQRGLWGSIKRGFKKAWSGVKKGAKKVWGGIKKGASAVWMGTKWLSRQLWSKLTGVFWRVVGWFRKLPQRLGRLFSHLWQGVKSLKPWSLSWWKSLGELSTWIGFLEWLGTSLIYLLEAAGIGEIYETVMDFIKFNTRPLTGAEIAKAKIVFSNTIDYGLVRVDERALLGPSWTDREYVSFNIINAWGPMSNHTLIHELTHVWQYTKMGAIYMPKAIHAQNAGGYEYGGVAELRKRQAAGHGFTSFNLEQQGEILGDYYVGRTSGTLSPTDLQTYEHFVRQVRR